jgi:hypothetical protein
MQRKASALEHDVTTGLKPLAVSALEGIEKLGNSIVALYQAPDQSYEATKNRVATCKGQSKVVAHRFNALHARAADILKRVGKVSPSSIVSDCNGLTRPLQNLLEATRMATSAEAHVKRVGEMEAISDAMKVNALAIQETRQ